MSGNPEITDADIVGLMNTFPNQSIADYASRLGMHPTALIRRLEKAPLKAALASNRAESLADAAILAESLACRAVNTVAMIMDCPVSQDKDRIAAAKAMIDIGIKLSEAVHASPQIELLKHQLEERGIEVRHAKKYGRQRGESTAVPSIRDIPPPIETPESAPEPTSEVMERIRDILKRSRSEG